MERRPTSAGVDSPTAYAPTTPATRSRPRWMPSILGVLVGVCLCAAALLVSHLLAPAPPPSASAVESALCADLTSHHYVELHGLLAPSLATQGSAQAFAANQQQLDAMVGPVSSCDVEAQQMADASATFDLRLTRAKSSATVTVRLTLVDGQWRISAYDTSWI